MRRLLAGLAVAAALAAPTARAAAQVAWPEETDFHNSTYVGDEPEPARLAFYRAEEQRVAGRPLDAGREILKLLRGETSGRVRQGDRLVLPLETAATLFLLRLPAEVRAQLAAEEAALGAAAPRDLDPAALRAFAERHPLSADGEAAWLRAGTLELLAGDAAAACADLERLVHWPAAYPGTLRALAAARLASAQARLGEAPNGGPLAHWPLDAAVVERGSGSATIAELLGPLRDAAHARERGESSGAPQLRFVLKMAAPDDARLAPHRLRFTQPNDLPELRAPYGELVALQIKDLPARAPLLLGERLVTLESEAPFDGAPAAIHVRGADGSDLFAPIRTDFDLHLDPRDATLVLDRAALAAAGDRLFVTLELREPGQSLAELLTIGAAATTALFGLDLAREGFVEFGVTSRDLAADPELAGLVFSGPPAVSGGRLLVTASRLVGKETECVLLAFDARSGALAGHTLLARASSIPMFGGRFMAEEVRRVVPSPVVVRDGTAYVCTNLGVIGAVRAADLELEWIFRYHRIDPPEEERYDRVARYVRGPWLGRAPVALADRVLVTPSDSLYLYSLARWPNAEGDLLLNDPIEKQQRICWLGADERTCWFLERHREASSTSCRVEATDHDGSHRWSSVDLLGAVTGVPALSKRFLFVPTDRCIYRIDLDREGFSDLTLAPPLAVGVPAPEFGVFGDLAVGTRGLVSTSELFTMLYEAPEK